MHGFSSAVCFTWDQAFTRTAVVATLQAGPTGPGLLEVMLLSSILPH